MGAAAIPLALAAVSAGAQYVNTRNTARAQDNQAAQAIRDQAAVQQKADADVNQTVDKLATSTAAGAEQQRLADYMGQLRQNRTKVTSGLTPSIGSATFQQGAAQTADAVNAKAAQTAGLMATMDAAGLQRQQEGFDYGDLSTALANDQRLSQNAQFMDQLRLNSIRRNAGIDLAAGLLSAGAGSMAARGMPAAAAGASSGASNIPAWASDGAAQWVKNPRLFTYGLN